jgi:ABC-2 type transport system permease protein
VLRGLWRLTWLEIKIFLREPLGAVGAVALPVLTYLVLGRVLGRGRVPAASGPPADLLRVGVPVLAAIMIGLTALLSLVTIISIYREGGILRRLRATPLRPWTILTAHVIVKLLLTAATAVAMLLAGGRFYAGSVHMPIAAFTGALVISTLSILSMGFLIASLVPTARFAQPIAGAIFYPMIALSGLFFPIELMPASLQLVARLLPLTYVVSLLRGVLNGDPWSAHATDLAALALVFALCTALSSRAFRWE